MVTKNGQGMGCQRPGRDMGDPRQQGAGKQEAITVALSASISSIIGSALSFFAATVGVAFYSRIDMIGSLCTLMSRGAIISMFVAIFILPAMFVLFDGIICATSRHFGPAKEKAPTKEGSCSQSN